MNAKISWLFAGWLFVRWMTACSEFETEYFKDRVNEATMERVAKRYGIPHSTEVDGNRIRWTYFDRGSGTVGYSGIARKELCYAYILIFDREEVLRDWRRDECQS
jgi:hypothetical protein